MLAITRDGCAPALLFLATDDFDRDCAAYTEAGVTFVRPPAVQPDGGVAVFDDLYGNRWDLVGPGASATVCPLPRRCVG